MRSPRVENEKRTVVKTGDHESKEGLPFAVWTLDYQTNPWANQEVAGESYRMAEIRRVLDGPSEAEERELWTWAALVPEPTNRHDPNAVAVICQGERVGYLPRQDAVRYALYITGLSASGLMPYARARIWTGRREQWVDEEER